MCWSATASIAATALGGAATVYAAKKDVPKVRVFALGFFTLMELLQAVSYIWINQCATNSNITLTYLGYVHIAFQIPVVNAFMLSFISEKKRKKWFRPVMVVSFLATFMMLVKLFAPVIWPIPKEMMCKIGDSLCGTNACSYEGNWHLAWRLPLLQFDPHALLYFVPVFILPLFYGCWRFSIFHFIFGPFLASLLTTDQNEIPAIWCLFSIALASSILYKPLRRWFETPMREKS